MKKKVVKTRYFISDNGDVEVRIRRRQTIKINYSMRLDMPRYMFGRNEEAVLTEVIKSHREKLRSAIAGLEEIAADFGLNLEEVK